MVHETATSGSGACRPLVAMGPMKDAWAGGPGADGSWTLAGDRVVLLRQIAGATRRITVPLADYLGVALRVRPAPGGPVFETVLTHDDADLCITLGALQDDTDVIACWRQQAAELRLPLLIEDEAGIRRVWPEPASSARRLGRSTSGRRPRFLARRKGALPGPLVILAKREITAAGRR